jgi:uncharacterized protein
MTKLQAKGWQAQGKVRRFIQSNLFPRQTQELLKMRQGDCDRCGECCKILFRCPFLGQDSKGEYLCRIYQRRFSQCRLFPIQPRDLREVTRCSYTFASAESQGLQPQAE